MKIDIENWVSVKLIAFAGILSLVFLTAAVLFYKILFISIPGIIFFLFFIYAFGYLIYARRQFSTYGNNIQGKISGLVLDYLDAGEEGRLIDIGCGNGLLTIKMALKCPNVSVTGVDYWGGLWGYSKEECRKKALKEGLKDRMTFEKASAESLPFGDEEFDIAVSNMVFHEAGKMKDKRNNIKEALRVVKKGGRFVFQDMFNSRIFYGGRNSLLDYIKSLGVRKADFVNTKDSAFIPGGLKNPIFVGDIAIIYGIK